MSASGPRDESEFVMTIVRADAGIDLTKPAHSHPAQDREIADGLAEGLRALAEFIDANPGLAPLMSTAFDHMLTPANHLGRDAVVAAARAGARFPGCTVGKHQNDAWAGVDLAFSTHVSVHVYISREEICERIVVGSHEVVETVPDPEALAAVPKVDRVKVVEDVEWHCIPLLADEGPDGGQS